MWYTFFLDCKNYWPFCTIISTALILYLDLFVHLFDKTAKRWKSCWLAPIPFWYTFGHFCISQMVLGGWALRLRLLTSTYEIFFLSSYCICGKGSFLPLSTILYPVLKKPINCPNIDSHVCSCHCKVIIAHYIWHSVTAFSASCSQLVSKSEVMQTLFS